MGEHECFESAFEAIDRWGIACVEGNRVPYSRYGAKGTFPIEVSVGPGYLEKVLVIGAKVTGWDVFLDEIGDVERRCVVEGFVH